MRALVIALGMGLLALPPALAQDAPASATVERLEQPGPPERERAIWHFFYFNTERGRAALAADRRRLCRYFWETWSPMSLSLVRFRVSRARRRC